MDVPDFEQFFYRYRVELVNYAMTLVRDREDAADVVQHAFVKLWQHRKNVEMAISGRAYLYKTVYNMSLDVIKHRGVRQRYAEALALSVSYESEDNFILERLKQVEHAVEQLPEQCRKVFLLSRTESKKYKEIAVSLQISEKTVENHMGNALKILRKILIKKP